MRVQPVKPITQAYFNQRRPPYPRTKCEACGRRGQAVMVADEVHVLCPDCTDYVKQVQRSLPKDSVDWFDAVGPTCRRIAWAGIIGFVVYYGAHLLIWALR